MPKRSGIAIASRFANTSDDTEPPTRAGAARSSRLFHELEREAVAPGAGDFVDVNATATDLRCMRQCDSALSQQRASTRPRHA